MSRATLSVPEQVLYELQWDGGWLTLEGIQLLVPHIDQHHLGTTLSRLRRKGAVTTREIPQNESRSWPRKEYRAL